jgi:hypothetical protein
VASALAILFLIFMIGSPQAQAAEADSSAEHQASHRVWPTLLKEGRFMPFWWSEIRALLEDEKPR